MSVLSFAMVQGAVYDAVNAIDRGHHPYLAEPAASPTDSEDAAAATAAFRVLVALFPTQQATLQPLYDASLAAVDDTPPGAKAGGIATGAAATAATLAARTDDGRFGPFTPVIGTTPGAWRPTPPLFPNDPAPWVGNVRPFLVPSAELLRIGADPTWTPLFDPSTPVAAPPALVTPPFPEHPSGHNCAAGAIVRTLRYFFATDQVDFSATTKKSATTRSFHRFSDALKENINARVWAGIHFRTADVQGAKLGRNVARYLHHHYLQPAD